jgi:hypothetical protein
LSKITERNRATKAAAQRALHNKITYGVFLDQLSDQLRAGLTTPARFEHRMDRREVTTSHTIWQHYCDAREVITELALDMKAPVMVDEFYRLDRCVTMRSAMR